MPGRNSHLNEKTASQGMNVYLRNCASSGLPQVQAKAEEYLSLGNKSAMLNRYLDEFGDHFPKGKNKPAKAAKPASKNLLDRLGEALGIEVVANDKPAKATRRSMRRQNKSGYTVGTEFVYNSSGVLWTITGIKGNVATATNGKRESTFKLTTLAISGVATIAA